jgi:hypothetical protein
VEVTFDPSALDYKKVGVAGSMQRLWR